MAAVRHLGFVTGSRGPPMKGLHGVYTCENFVMIDSVVFKLNGFEFFGPLCLKVHSGPQNSVFWEYGYSWVQTPRHDLLSNIPQKSARFGP